MRRCENCRGDRVSVMRTLDEELLFIYCHDCGHTIQYERQEQ